MKLIPTELRELNRGQRFRMVIACVIAVQTGREIGKLILSVRDLAEWAVGPAPVDVPTSAEVETRIGRNPHLFEVSYDDHDPTCYWCPFDEEHDIHNIPAAEGENPHD